LKLQLALDRLTRGERIRITEQAKNKIDTIEGGTGVIKEYGVSIIRELTDLYPDKTFLADMKICHAGKHDAEQAFKEGAEITSVMGFAGNQTIVETLNVAKEMNSRVMVDLLEIQSPERVNELGSLGVELVSLHVGKDKQTEGAFHTDLFSLIQYSSVQVAVAGGINAQTLPEIKNHEPDIIIVGSAITGKESPMLAATELREIID